MKLAEGIRLEDEGLGQLLDVRDAVIEYMPSPADVPAVKGIDDRGAEATRPATDDAKFSALAFKILNDPFVGNLTFFRVYSGVLNSGDQVFVPAKSRKERIGRLLQMHANEREEIKEVRAGDIAAAVGLKDVTTGEDIFNAGFVSAFEEAKAMPVFDKLAANLGLNEAPAPKAMPVFDKLAANLGLTEEAPAAAPETGMTLFEELLAKEEATKEAGKMDAVKNFGSKMLAHIKGAPGKLRSIASGERIAPLKAALKAREGKDATPQSVEDKRTLLKERLKTHGLRAGGAAALVADEHPRLGRHEPPQVPVDSTLPPARLVR
jgi:hypothetical protein